MKVISLFLALNVLVASTGLSLHTHRCNASDMISVNITQTGCKSEQKMSCCKESTDCNPQQDGNGCCSDEEQYYKEDLLATLTNEDLNILPVEFTAALVLIFERWYTDQSVVREIIPEGLPPGAYQSPPSVMFQVFRC